MKSKDIRYMCRRCDCTYNTIDDDISCPICGKKNKVVVDSDV